MTPFAHYILRIASRLSLGQCKRGHVLTRDAIYVGPRGRRECRICKRLRNRRHDRMRDAHRTRRRRAA